MENSSIDEQVMISGVLGDAMHGARLNRDVSSDAF